MSDKRSKRILKEFKELEEGKQVLEDSNIYFYYDENNINNLYAMIVGTEDTPYWNGYYFFEFEYPSEYPLLPPIAKYYTQGSLPTKDNKFNKSTNGLIRFNPNLYTNGKVCLSMLNTWSGPGWVPTNTITNVLVAIQATVLIKDPIKNEPGYSNNEDPNVINAYNEIIEYANLRISVGQVLTNTPPKFLIFKDIMINLFNKNKENIKNFILQKSNKSVSSIYNMENIIIDYEYLYNLIDELKI